MKQSRKKNLREYAKMVRREYIKARRRFEVSRTELPSYWKPTARMDGAADRLGRTKPAVWPELAEFFVRHNINVQDYLFTAFLCAGFSPPTPWDLMKQSFLNHYRKKVKASAKDTEITFNFMRTFCKTQILSHPSYDPTSTDKSVTAAVLLDADLPLSALFRYCLARSEQLEGVAELYKAQAAVEYMRTPDDYDQVWGPDWIPADFADEAEILCQSM